MLFRVYVHTLTYCVDLKYDVELCQRIEGRFGKKLEMHPHEENEVMVLLERMSEAPRTAMARLRAITIYKMNRGKEKVVVVEGGSRLGPSELPKIVCCWYKMVILTWSG